MTTMWPEVEIVGGPLDGDRMPAPPEPWRRWFMDVHFPYPGDLLSCNAMYSDAPQDRERPVWRYEHRNGEYHLIGYYEP